MSTQHITDVLLLEQFWRRPSRWKSSRCPCDFVARWCWNLVKRSDNRRPFDAAHMLCLSATEPKTLLLHVQRVEYVRRLRAVGNRGVLCDIGNDGHRNVVLARQIRFHALTFQAQHTAIHQKLTHAHRRCLFVNTEHNNAITASTNGTKNQNERPLPGACQQGLRNHPRKALAAQMSKMTCSCRCAFLR